jgi:hypothetical protein
MKTIQTNETWEEFKSLCLWHDKSTYCETCSRGKFNADFICAERLCPRIKETLSHI